MRVLITGAAGFLGCAILAEAVAAGHQVTAVVRTALPDSGICSLDEVRVVPGDLRVRGEWCDALADTQAVIHAAAAAGGDRGLQLSNTIVGTENLLSALSASAVERFVHISSFSVYDYAGLRTGGVVDENTPLETRPGERDAYTETKLVQETLVREWCGSQGVPCIVLRPGAIAGAGRDWEHGAAVSMGRFSLVFSPRAPFRMISVANCASAAVRALELPKSGDATVNLVDDELPTHAEFFRRCRDAGADLGYMVPVPWAVVSGAGAALQLVNRGVLAGRMKLPEILDHPRQQVRWKPLRYPNDRARAVLNWRPEQPVEATIARIVGGGRDTC
jgi:nucleoside-diphosphate-sugar epimerase